MQVEVRQRFHMPAVFDVPDSWLGLSSRRARIKALTIQARSSEVAQVQLDLAESELSQLIDTCGFHLWRRDMLRQELAKTSEPIAPRAYLPGEPMARHKTQVLSDLAECSRWLANFSGDATLADEATRLQVELAAAYEGEN